MITIFKKNDILNLLLLLPYTIVLRAYSLIYPTAYVLTDADSILSHTLFSRLITQPLAQSVIGIILIYIHAILINQIVNKHRIYQRPSMLAAMSYVLITSCIPALQHLTPAMISMTFLILTVFSVFNTHKQTNAVKSITNSALNASLATMIYPPHAIIIIALMIALGMLRSFSNREKLQFVISWIVGFWIVGAFLYFLGLLDWSFWDHIGLVGSIGDIWQENLATYIHIGAIALLIIVILYNYFNYKKKKEIEIRKKIDFFYWMLLLGLVSLFVFRDLTEQHLLFLCLPIAIFLSLSWVMIRSSVLAEMIHFISVGLIMYNLFALG